MIKKSLQKRRSLRKNKSELDEGLMFIIITSSIESLVQEKKFKEFINWYRNESKQRNLTVEGLWEKYFAPNRKNGS